jgi:nucleoside-diphosphate-sugar epimerase
VLVRPPAILGAGETSVWNTLRPAEIRDRESERHAVPERTFAWVHVDDLATLTADVATGRIATSTEAASGPVDGGCTAVNVTGEPATARDYHQTVTTALGVEPVWDEAPSWTDAFLAERAQAWGWSPTVTLGEALKEIDHGLRA